MDKALFPKTAFRDWLRSGVILTGLRLCWLFLVALFAFQMPAVWSWEQVRWALGFLVLAAALAGGMLFRLCTALGVVKPATGRLAALVSACTEERRVPIKALWVLPSPAGFAAALPVQRALIFSDATVDDCDDDELAAICRHELAHLQEGRALVLLRVAQLPVALLPLIFTPTFVAGLGGIGILPPLLTWLVLQNLFLRLSLRLEKRADAAVFADAPSPAYARALEKLHRRNLVPAALAPKAARTHPDLYDRMIAAGVTPDYPRPAPPAEWHWLQILAILLSIATTLAWMSMNP